MKDNRGFTLIELIVVLLILAIISVGSMAGYNLLNAGNAKHASERILAILSSVQMENLTKQEKYSMEIVLSGDEYVVNVLCNGTVESSETLDIKNGQVTFTDSAGIVTTVGPAKLEVCFRKDTGGVKENSTNIIITRIGITSSGTTCYIRLVTATGKHFIE